MEIITGTAKDLVGNIFNYAFATVGRQVGYLIHYKRNLENLRTEVAKLSVAKETVSGKIALAVNMGEKIYPHVRDWLKKVAAITKEAEELLKDKQQTNTEDTSNLLKDDGQPKTKCVLGICPNPVLRRRRSKNSLTLVEGVTKLINEEKELSDISFKPPKGLKDLETEVDKLKVAKDTLAEKVAAAKVKGETIHANVQDWLKKVTEITEEVEEFLKDKHQSVEEATEFSKDEIQAIEKPNASLSHGSKELLELLQGVTELYEKRNFPDISYVVPPEDVCIASDADYEEFDSRSQMVEKILKELRSTSSSDMILVYGVGGVGKTTLVEEVLRKAQKEKLFQDAVMVRDVKVPNLEAIQKQIADKLGLILEAHTLRGRADKINERIKSKNTLFIFDDVWGEIDLKAVGLPHKSTCRILLTSRSQQVFSQQIKQKEFPLGVLDDKEAWALFEKKAGDVVADPTIRPVAAQVAKKCGGLPVLVITVARALENKNLPIWKNALIQLESFDEKGDLTQKAYSGIEWSYTQLSDKKQLQLLFLLCGSIALGNYISLTTLLKYGIGLGFFKDCTVEVARDALYTQVDKLKSCCLLLDGDDGTCVRMHDLVRDVANRIARRDQHALVEDGGHNKLGKWPDEEFFIECSKICLPCCKIATLPQVPWKCPQLELFHLVRDYDDAVGEIPNNFFEEMKKLKVLGLRSVLLKNLPSSVSSLKNLPSSVSSLKNLQTLCLDRYDFEDTNLAQVGELRNLEVLSMVYSKVRQLPQEFGQLTRLRLVDLSDCVDLIVIPAGVISNWTKLEDLRLRNSFDKWEGTAKESALTSIASLSELMNLPNLTALEVHIPDGNILPRKFLSDRLEKYQILIGMWYYSGDHMKETTDNILTLEHPPSLNLNENVKILLKKCHIFNLNGNGGDYSFLMKTKVVMPNLTTMDVSYCQGFKYLFTSSMVRSLVKLKYLKVLVCRDMEEIVSTTESHEEDVDNIFAKLERLALLHLPNFARFCTAGSCIDFPSLEELYVQFCPKLGENVLFDEKVVMPNLTTMNVSFCQGFKYLFTSSMVRSLVKLKYLKVLVCGDMEEIVSTTESHEEDVDNIFAKPERLTLDYLPNFARFGTAGSCIAFPSLEELNVQDCPKLGGNVLFDEKVVMPNLTTMDVSDCQGFKYLFTSSMVRSLVKLKYLKVLGCRDMEEIVSTTESHEEDVDNIFAKLERLTLIKLPNFARFGTAGSCIAFPSLEELNVQYCPKLGGNVLFDEKVVMPNLTTLHVCSCDGIKYLFTSSMVRSLVKLKYLTVVGCEDMEEIVSTTESHEEDVDNIFAKLERLTLRFLPNFARFCTAGSCIDFPSLEELHVGDCPKLGENVLFDEKVRFPRLEILKIIYHRPNTVLKKIWHNQLAPGSFCRLREFHLVNCSGVSSIFPPSMTGRLSGLETLVIRRCASARVVFDESGESTGPTTTHLKDGQNLKSVYIYECHELRYVFPASMVTRGLQQLQELSVDSCMGMRNVVGKEEGAVESTTHPRFIFPKVQSLRFESMDILESFYPAMHTSEWPSLESFEFYGGSLEAFAAEVSHFLQETQLHAPTKQPFFLIHKGSFPVLEKLVLPDSSEILYGPSSSPIELMFPKLKR